MTVAVFVLTLEGVEVGCNPVGVIVDKVVGTQVNVCVGLPVCVGELVSNGLVATGLIIVDVAVGVLKPKSGVWVTRDGRYEVTLGTGIPKPACRVAYCPCGF